MNSARFWKTGLIALGLLSVGTLMTGCDTVAALPPLDLYVDLANSLDEAVIVALDNPTKARLFVPVAWTGLAVFQEMPSGAWVELKCPDGFQSMVSTAEKILYPIPVDALAPGNYILVLQGRAGREGVPFYLEAQVGIVNSPDAKGGTRPKGIMFTFCSLESII